MRKLFFFLCALFTGVSAAWAGEPITLTFERSDGDVSVFVNGANGATATFTEESGYGLKDGGSITEAILCPNINANTDPTIVLKFTVDNLPADFQFNTVSLFIHALNASGGYQSVHNPAVNNVPRRWNVEVGINNENVVTATDLDIALNAVQASRDLKTEQSRTLGSSSITLTLTLTAGTDNPGCFFGLESITLQDIDPKDVAFQNLQSVYDTYYGYYDSFTPGTDPGQYGVEEVAAFRAVLDLVANLDGPDSNYDELTAEDLDRLAEQIVETYQAVLNSLVNLSISSGYYRIKNGGLTYTQNVTNENGESQTVEVDKYMYVNENGTTLSGAWGSVDDLSNHAPSLWKLTDNGGGTFELVNMAFNAQFNKGSQSATYTLQTDSTELMYIKFSPREDRGDAMYMNIRVATQTGAYAWLHQGGHNNGAGISGNVVGWTSGPAASEWLFVPVSDEEAEAIMEAYAPIRDRELMLASYNSIMTNAKANLEIAYDLKKTVDTDQPLITDNSQFSSPYTETSEGSLDNLLDGDASTYWHSIWTDGAVAFDTHYLQVEVNDADIPTLAAVVGYRSNATGNFVTVMNVRGTNNADAEKEDCELLGTINLPFNAAGNMNVVSDVFEAKNYRYLRFYPVTTVGDASNGFFHLAEFQLYPAEAYQSETAQAIMLGELYTNLKAVVDAQKDMETEDIQKEQYEKLKAAYEAFMEKFVDPTELRNTMKNLGSVLATIRTDKSDPGFWTSESAGDGFKAIYDAAEAYDAAGVYTTEQSADYIEMLNKQYKDIYASAIQVQEGKWYRIRFPEEEDFEKYGWDKVAGNGSATVPSLFGKYASVADLIVDAETNEEHIESVDPEYVAVGHTLHFQEESDLSDNALFRFIAVGDTAYMMQNKSTGLFLKAKATNDDVIVSAHPTLFNVSATGLGTNLIAAKNLTGTAQNNLHAAVSGNTLRTWNASGLGSRSAFYIEEAEDVDNDYDGTLFNIAELNMGSVTGYCFPVEISVPEDTDAEMWTVNSVDVLDDDSLSLSVSLAQIEGNVAPAGRPFILVYGAPEEYNAEEEGDMVVLKHGYEIGCKEPETDQALKGTFTGGTLAAGRLMTEGNSIVVNKRSNTSIAANSAYINPGWTAKTSATVEVQFDASAPDGIQSALQSVSHSGAVYTIDGRLVSKKAGLSDLQKFGKGVYILNGTKVVVK